MCVLPVCSGFFPLLKQGVRHFVQIFKIFIYNSCLVSLQSKITRCKGATLVGACAYTWAAMQTQYPRYCNIATLLQFHWSSLRSIILFPNYSPNSLTTCTTSRQARCAKCLEQMLLDSQSKINSVFERCDYNFLCVHVVKACMHGSGTDRGKWYSSTK